MIRRISKTVGLLIALFALTAQAEIQITDLDHYDTAGQMLLANEINESGEPYAEALGYDLGLLDPFVPGFPDETAYALGIENYEYSRYQLGVVVARSGIGLHMMWSPIIVAKAAMETDPDFDGSWTGGTPNGYNEDDELVKNIMHFGMLADHTPPMHAWPQFGEFVSADPHYAQPVDPGNFTTDFATLRWDRSAMIKQLSPSAMGQTLMKQYLWAQDMLGAFHDANGDEVVPDGVVTPDGPDGIFDPDNGVFFGGDDLDGFIGQVLTAEAVNKVKNLIESLAFDGQQLGGVDPMTYDPGAGLLYFPHLIGVTESAIPDLPPRVSDYSVVDPHSDLFDQASMLWGTTHFKNMMDPANSEDSAHLAYHSVFDGDPFPADMGETGVPGPFDLMKGASKVLFLNLMAMHFDPDFGTFANSSLPLGSGFRWNDASDPISEFTTSGLVRRGNQISAVSAAYAIVALTQFAAEFDGTPLAAMALDAIAAQADFIIDRMGNDDDLYRDRVSIHHRSLIANGPYTLQAQTAAIRALYSAFTATGDTTYRSAADAAYGALVDTYYSPADLAFRTRIGESLATYTPGTVALVSGALREARLIGGFEAATSIYVDFWNNVVNRLQLAEGGNTGELGGDSDADGIPFIPEQPDGVAPVLAPEATLLLSEPADFAKNSKSSGGGTALLLAQNDPNPFNPKTTIRFALDQAGPVALKVYDTQGRRVETLVDATLSAGSQQVTFNADKVPSGVYFYVLEAGGRRAKKKMVLLK